MNRPTPPSSANGKRQTEILVVDDAPANLQLLAAMLKERGFKPRPVPSGSLALQAARSSPPDLVLLDINMPDMNGYEVCEQFKADATLADIPILFVSAMHETIDKVRAFGVGGVDYVTKPFQFEEVEARVRAHLEIARQRRELAESYTRLRELEELRDTLVHMIVHDIRNGLNSVRGYLELLHHRIDAHLDDKGQQYFDLAFSQTVMAIELSSGILDVSRLESGQMQANCAIVDVGPLIGDALQTLGLFSGLHHLTWTPPPTPLCARCDAELVRRVLANLLINAVKFTPRGGDIAVRASADAEMVRVEVTDSGPGIRPDDQARIFDKYVQATGGRRPHSTGLGLTFCRLALAAQQGAIGVISDGTRGSTFWFTLPRAS